MWATADETREQIVGLYHRVWANSDATIAELELDATGQVPWWPEDRRTVTLHQILVHMIAETDRHAGHADIVRELIDGAAGLRDGNDNLPEGDASWWEAYRQRLEQVARQAGSRADRIWAASASLVDFRRQRHHSDQSASGRDGAVVAGRLVATDGGLDHRDQAIPGGRSPSPSTGPR